MRVEMTRYQIGIAGVLGLAATCWGLAGCSSGDDSNEVTNPAAGGSGAPTAGTTGGAAGTTPGAAGTSGGSGAGGSTPAGGTSGGTAGTTPPAGGSSGTGTAGDSGGAAGEEMTAGTGGSGEAGTGGGNIDTTGFMANCESGGDNWGTPGQAGPCAAGTSIYGVMTMFGPYGVSSEYNVGQGFENVVSASDNASGCSSFIDSFGADPVGSADLKDTHDLNLALYTVFYPGFMPEGEKFPLISWGNGTCAMPEGYGPLLRYVASFGYIVVAANSRYVGDGSAQKKAIDFMFAENMREGSKYFGRIDTDKVGAMGHSQGGMGTAAAAGDARIKSVILFNGGSSASKPYLAISGDRDLLTSVAAYRNAVNAAPRPAAWLFYHQVPTAVMGSTTGTLAPGHLTLMMEPERVIEPTVAWWDMMLKGKESAKAMFLGDSCTLCNPDAYPSMWGPSFVATSPSAIEYGHNTMLQ
jgi:hypothetical protein